MLVKLYIGEVESFLERRFEKIPVDIHSIQILEAPSQTGEGKVIDCFKFSPGTHYVETHRASENSASMWYRVRFISDPEVYPVRVFGVTEYLLPEVVAKQIDSLRGWLGDYDPTGEDANFEPVFSDEHCLQMIRYAMQQHRGIDNLSLVRETDWIPIQTLARIEYAMIIAYEHAKYYQLAAPGNASLNLSEIKTHYLQVAKDLRDNYAEMRKRLNMDGGGYDSEGNISQMPAVQEGVLYRYSRSRGRYVYDPAAAYRANLGYPRDRVGPLYNQEPPQVIRLVDVVQGPPGPPGPPGPSLPTPTNQFEAISKNLDSNPYTLNYTGAQLTSIVYTMPYGTITKTFNYSLGKVVSIVLSGDTPAGISLMKTFTYSGDNLVAVGYA